MDDSRIRRPQQARSQRTLERLFKAAESVIGENGFDRTPISDILARAKCSVGSFYARFEGRDAFYDAFCGRLFARRAAEMEDYLDPSHWLDTTAAEIVPIFLADLVRWHRAQQPLLRAVILYIREHPDPALRTARQRMNSRIATGMTKLLLARDAEIAHPDPRLAVRVGLHFLWHTIRESILFDDRIDNGPPISDRILTRELSRAFCSYLGIETPR